MYQTKLFLYDICLTVLQHQVGALKGLQELDHADEHELASSPNRTATHHRAKFGEKPELIGEKGVMVPANRGLHAVSNMVKEAQILQEATKAALAAAGKREEKVQMERDALRVQLAKLKSAEDGRAETEGTCGERIAQVGTNGMVDCVEMVLTHHKTTVPFKANDQLHLTGAIPNVQATKAAKQLQQEVQALKSEKASLLQSSKDLRTQVLEETLTQQVGEPWPYF